jgi:glycosyltransferase involved in cell wall biosynthesis
MNLLDVSVVIPCFNATKTIIRCLDSVAAQTELPLEIVVVDDGSEDEIASLVDQWRDCNVVPLHIIQQVNRGAASARNTGISAAKGRYIALLDADDIWLPDKLKIQREIMERECLTLCGHSYLFEAKNLHSNVLNVKSSSLQVKRFSKWDFVYRNPFFTPTVMIDKNHFSGFDERFRRADDYKAWVENIHQDRCGFINHVLAAGFKPPIGHSGLTGSIYKMHISYLEVLKALRHEKKISKKFYFGAVLIEFVKYPLRYAYSKIWIKK